MATKPEPLAFGPAPRPSPRVSQALADQLSAETADLGFGRATSAPDAQTPEAAADSAPTPAEPGPRRIAAAKPLARSARAPAAPSATRPEPAELTGSASLKFDVPGDLWTALKIEAAQRRVTVKFLVLEALSKQGYAVDLQAVPEDGRRLR
jgi:hypothetical protein